MLPAPRSARDLTPAWMNCALAARLPGVVLDRVDVLEVEWGTNRRVRVALGYASGSGPARVFVKMQGTAFHRLLVVALGALTTEARLAQSSLRLRLEHPRTYAVALDRRRLRVTVVMEDVTARSGRPNDATAPLGLAAVHDGLQGLARLHAAYWERPLPSSLAFLRRSRLGRGWAPVSHLNLARGLRRLREEGREGLIPPSATARALEHQFRASARLAATGPQTVLHGDPHPGNTYSLPGEVTGFYDWQLARTGSWSHDVGYFLISSLDIASRRAHERDLLRSYLDALAAAGVSPPGFEAAWGRYRAAPAFGLGTWLHTYAFGGLQPIAVCLATLERFGAAYVDLEIAIAPALIAPGG